MEEQLYSYIRIDAGRERALPHEEVNPQPGSTKRIFRPRWVIINGERFPVWATPYDTARQHIGLKPEWFKLWRCDPINIQLTNKHGTIEWHKFFPWKEVVKHESVLDADGNPKVVDEETNELETITKIVWVEDKELETVERVVSEETLRETSNLKSDMENMQAEIERLAARNIALMNQIRNKDVEVAVLEEKLKSTTGQPADVDVVSEPQEKPRAKRGSKSPAMFEGDKK